MRQAADALREADKEKVRAPETEGSLTVNPPSNRSSVYPKLNRKPIWSS
jgi:hypothetical protein